MPADGDGGAIDVRTEGGRFLVDARPARLVSQLRDDRGDPVVTAEAIDGSGGAVPVPADARQVRVQVSDDLSVEATRLADFAAMAADDGGWVVAAFAGEVTVVPGGADGDRFALAAHEALLMPVGGGTPRLLDVHALSDDDRRALDAVLSAGSADAPAHSPADAPAALVEPATLAEPAGAARAPKPGWSGSRRPKGGSHEGSGTLTPVRRSTGRRAARSPGARAHGLHGNDAVDLDPGGHDTGGHDTAGHDAGGHDEASYMDTSGDWMFVVGVIAAALVIAVGLALFVFDSDAGGGEGALAVAAVGFRLWTVG